MIRTVVSLDEDDKRWLDRRAQEEGVPMTELVRRAVRRLRAEDERPSFDDVVEASRGIWKQGDGLKWQEELRREWDGRSSCFGHQVEVSRGIATAARRLRGQDDERQAPGRRSCRAGCDASHHQRHVGHPGRKASG